MGITTENLFLLFVIGSLIGFLVETVYCYRVKGRLESRRGMVYGPFSQIYGFGAVFLVLCLVPLARYGSFPILFFGSAILGGIFEALCSVFQEKTFGTRSWDYSEEKFSFFDGRTSLRYMCYWGILGTSYIGIIHPILFSLIGMIPVYVKSSLISLLFLFLAFDLLLTCVALQRWGERQREIPAKVGLYTWVDRRFPDERMERIYPDMIPVEKQSREALEHATE